jgi:anaerobic selenocysteine-containing dehydrogenase
MSLHKSIEMNRGDGAALIMCDTVIPATPSGKIELFSTDLEEKYGYGVPRYEPVASAYSLTLITPSSAKRTNATFGGCAPSAGLEIVEMHPDDAAERGLCAGDIVTVSNQRGAATFELVVTDDTRPGVLYSPKGAWRQSSETGMTSNVLIPSDIRTDIADGACYNETFVDVHKR